MVQKIALFNHRGGVGKTTTTFNLGWMLAQKGKIVIIVDTDPQCNLTGMALRENDESDEIRIENIYKTHSNIKTGLEPAFESQPRAIEAVDCIPIQKQENLFLLPGHVGFAEYEVTLGFAQELTGSIQALKNLPGSIFDLFNKTAQKYNADYLLIDMSPSLGAINQNLLMISDFFIVPTTADFFSLMAINSLGKVLPRWLAWAKNASKLPILKEASYPFPDVRLKFLGTIVQNYRTIHGRETVAYQKWIDKIQTATYEQLITILQKNGATLSQEIYNSLALDESLTLTKIPNFNSLIAISQEYGVPIYDLTLDQLKANRQVGKVADDQQEKQQQFKAIFSDLADKVIGLTSSV